MIAAVRPIANAARSTALDARPSIADPVALPALATCPSPFVCFVNGVHPQNLHLGVPWQTRPVPCPAATCTPLSPVDTGHVTEGTPPEGLPTRHRSKALASLRIVVPVMLLVLLWQLVDGRAVLRLLGEANPGWIAAAVLAANLQIVLSALRWRITAGALGQSLSARQAIAEYYLSQLVNLTLPFGVLGDAGRAVRMRHQAGMIRAGQAVMIERMSGQIALLAVMMAGFAALPLIEAAVPIPSWVRHVVLSVGLGAAGIVLGFAAARHVPGLTSRASRGFLMASGRALLARDLWHRQIGLSLLVVACNLATVAYCARATGTDLGLVATVTLVPVMLLAMVLPISVAGWGLREGAAAALWPIVGATAAAGVAASIAFGLVILVSSLPGVLTIALASRIAPPGPAPEGRQTSASGPVRQEPSPDRAEG